MSQSATFEPVKNAPEPPRRERILDAAQACFVRSGFHRATMQEVAQEADMSPGNLYRTFPSKEAIVVGLCERDQAALVREFMQLPENIELIPAVYQMLRRQFTDKPPEFYFLILEIWSQSTRNPELARVRECSEDTVRAHILKFLQKGQAMGKINPETDLVMAVKVLFTLVSGLFRSRAHEADFDVDDELAMTMGVFAKVLDGTVKPMKFSIEDR
ncbi:MAG: TetR/AcrR family transcriptional regulator [Hyphomicrobiales bacterium]|nr:TetR/AcrR family transcriptional regulator [Hyphomicrobiales bacterium]MDE2114830.1 TetR/AcrR family transcriptional regulator [Hyphomicrobiales bacterium]